MKFYTFILACYTMTLSIAPCNDFHEGQSIIPMTIEAAQEHHEEDNDVCSPFCLCACCQGFVVITAVKYVQAAPVFSTEKFSFYFTHFPSPLAGDHWQPPRSG